MRRASRSSPAAFCTRAPRRSSGLGQPLPRGQCRGPRRPHGPGHLLRSEDEVLGDLGRVDARRRRRPARRPASPAATASSRSGVVIARDVHEPAGPPGSTAGPTCWSRTAARVPAARSARAGRPGCRGPASSTGPATIPAARSSASRPATATRSSGSGLAAHLRPGPGTAARGRRGAAPRPPIALPGPGRPTPARRPARPRPTAPGRPAPTGRLVGERLDEHRGQRGVRGVRAQQERGHPVRYPQRPGQHGPSRCPPRAAARARPAAPGAASRARTARRRGRDTEQVQGQPDGRPAAADVVVEVAVEPLEPAVHVGRHRDQQQLDVDAGPGLRAAASCRSRGRSPAASSASAERSSCGRVRRRPDRRPHAVRDGCSVQQRRDRRPR